MHDFSKTTKNALAKKGIFIIGICVIPNASDLPFCSGERGYKLNDNGCLIIRTFSEVLEISK